MPTRRMIDPSFWQSESMAELNEGERLFFLGLISNADDQGRIRGHPALLRSLIYPFDDISTEIIEARIEVLSNINCIFVYETNGKRAIQIIKWWDYQSPQWAYPSKMDPPPDWSDRLRYRSDNKVHQENWNNGSGGFMVGDSIDDYTNLGKGLGKALPKELGSPIELEVEVDSTTTTIADENLNIEADSEFAVACRCWQENIGALNPVIADELRNYSIKCQDGWLVEAIKQSAINGVRKWSYIRTILDSWIEAGQITDKPKQKGKSNGQYKSQGNSRTNPARPAGYTLDEQPSVNIYTGEIVPPDG